MLQMKKTTICSLPNRLTSLSVMTFASEAGTGLLFSLLVLHSAAGKRNGLCELVTWKGRCGAEDADATTKWRDWDRCFFRSASVQETPDKDGTGVKAAGNGKTAGDRFDGAARLPWVLMVTETWMSILLSLKAEAVTIWGEPKWVDLVSLPTDRTDQPQTDKHTKQQTLDIRCSPQHLTFIATLLPLWRQRKRHEQ